MTVLSALLLLGAAGLLVAARRVAAGARRPAEAPVRNEDPRE